MRKVRMKRDGNRVAARLVEVQKLRSGGDLGDEILGVFGVTAAEAAMAIECSERTIQHWVKKGVLTPVASRGDQKVFSPEDVVGLWI